MASLELNKEITALKSNNIIYSRDIIIDRSLSSNSIINVKFNQKNSVENLKDLDSLNILDYSITDYSIMDNLHILDDNIINGFYINSLNIVAILAILSGIFVIISKNPIVSILFLIGLFLTISIYLMILGINFIGLSYLLVYVGAVSILFIFILMLINIRISEITTSTNNSIPLGIFIGTTFFSTIYKALPITTNYESDNDNIIQFISNIIKSIYNDINYRLNSLYSIIRKKTKNDMLEPIQGRLISVYHETWDNILRDSSHISTIGSIIYTSYPIWIILTSLILLLSMIGAIIITLRN